MTKQLDDHCPGPSCHPLLHPVLWLAQGFALFPGLTIYAAMDQGAQDQGKRGWAVALLWSVGLLIVLHNIRAVHDFVLL
jgi:hypothetical protein